MNSLAVTSARVAILQLFFTKKQPFTGLTEILQSEAGEINRTTLYRSMLSFCAMNILYKIIDQKSHVFYGVGDRLRPYIRLTALTGKDNFHFQCLNCRNIFCLPVKIPLIEFPAGFIKTDANVIFFGKCDHCNSKAFKISTRPAA